jgi:hypothetical protein
MEINGLNQTMSVMDSGFARDNMVQQIAVSVLKQVQDNQQSQGQAIVQMINQSTPQGTGKLLNILA